MTRHLRVAAWLLGCVSIGHAPIGCTPTQSPAEAPQASSAASDSESGVPANASAHASTGSEPKGPTPPDFELDDLRGGSVRLSEHLGNKVILIDFWATFCVPCLAAMPHLQDLYVKHKDEGLLILGISIDGPDSLAQVRTEVSKLGVTFPILLDSETSVVQLYNPKTSAPFSVLIGRDGRIIKKKEGYTTGDGTGLAQDVEQALAK